MALSMIPNPKKVVVVNSTIEDIKVALIRIPTHVDKGYTLIKYDEFLNQFTFSGSEFLSLGVFIEVNLNYVSENKTSIEIEIRRKLGAFDNALEVQRANQHIQKLLYGISSFFNKQSENSAPIEADLNIQNPAEEIKFNFSKVDLRRHLDTFLKTYPNSYSEDIISQEDKFAILRRKPQKLDDNYLEIDAIIYFYILTSDSISTVLKIEITNDDNKMSTKAELKRNSLILKITIKLFNKIISDLEAQIKKAEQYYEDLKGWQPLRSKEKKKKDLEDQLIKIENLKNQLRQKKHE